MEFAGLVAALDRDRGERALFHDLMARRVREILLVGSLYDSFVVESDGFLTEQITGEFSRLNLSTIPRVTSAYTDESALERFSSGACDLVIIMAGLDFDRPFRLAMEMKSREPGVPILLLVLNNSSLAELDLSRPELAFVDRVFVWNGYSKLLVGMIKYVEDKSNADADTASGLVKVILIIEDSIRYYSRYLPLIYTLVLKQTQDLIEEERGVETYRLLRVRARPKILLASSYEEAEATFARYESSILALITDLRFQRGGRLDPEGGFSFVAMARGRKPGLPVMIQSSEVEVRARAESLGAAFADKSSESLALELGDFIRRSLGFGGFRFLGREGEVLAVAATIDEFVRRVGEVPADCLMRHAERNEFSTWLTARGEYRFAAHLRRVSVGDFASPEELRSFLLRFLDRVRLEKSEGLVPDFDEIIFRDPASMTRLGSGSVGGKGRGVEFLGKILDIEGFGPAEGPPLLGMPRTLFIGIDLFEDFLERNGLWSLAFYGRDSRRLDESLAGARFPEAFLERARRFLSACEGPLIVRSSGLLEDQVRTPLAGVYGGLVLPNRGADPEARLEALLGALKGVWASLFSAGTRRHFDALGYDLEEERMALLVQELVGSEKEGLFAPLCTGLAWSRSPAPAAGGGRGGPAFALCPGLGFSLGAGRPALVLETRGAGRLAPRAGRVGGGLGLRLGAEATFFPTTGDFEERPVDGSFLEWSLAALSSPPISEALASVLDMGIRSFGNEVLVEFALVDRGAGLDPGISLLQIRPMEFPPVEGGGSKAPPLKTAIAGGEFFGWPPPPFRDFLVLDQGRRPTEPRLVEALRSIDARHLFPEESYALVAAGGFQPSGPEEVPLVFSDLSKAALILRPSGQGSPVPIGSRLFCNLFTAGRGWLDLADCELGELCRRLAEAGSTLIEAGEGWRLIRSPRPFLIQGRGPHRGLVPG